MRQPLQTVVAAWVKLPYLPLWLVPLLLFFPILLTGKALFWGTPALQFVPWLNLAWESLISGHLPLWNDLVGMGAPLLANYQSALLYPPTWIYFVLAAVGGVPALAWGQALLVVFHLVWSGLGMALLIRRLEMGSLAQAVAGLSFSLSGYMVARAGFLSINAAAAWLPWMLIPALALAQRRQIKTSVLLLALTAGFQLLSGHAQTAAYSLGLVFAWITFWSWEGVRFQKDWLLVISKAWATALIGILGGVALAAVQLLPTAEYLLESQRAAAVDYEVAMTYSFWPWRLLSFVAPDLFGNPVHGDYWGYGAYWEDAIYVGLLPFLLGMGLIFAGFILGRKTVAESGTFSRLPAYGRPLTIALVALLIVTFILAFGQNTLIFPWLYRNIPGFDMFQAPTRFTIWAVFAFSILGGLGVEAWRRPIGRGLYWTRLGSAGAFAVTLGAGISWAFLGDVRPTFIRATALAGLWGLGVGALALTGPDRETNKVSAWWPWAVILLMSADLLVAGWGLNPSVEADFYAGQSSTALRIQDPLGDGRLYLAPTHEYDLKFGRFLRFQSFQADEDLANLRETLLPNLHMIDGIPHTANFDPLVPGRYTRWMQAVENADPADKEKLLNLSGVTLVEITDSTVPLGVDFHLTPGTGSRFRWVNCSRWVSSREAAWDAVIAPAFVPDTEVILEGENPSGRECTEAQLLNLQVLETQSNRVSILVETNGPGWLIQSDVWFPGWTAVVDGERVPLLVADYLFRGIPVPEGSHRVDITYRPFWFYAGLLMSVGAWILVGVHFVRKRQ